MRRKLYRSSNDRMICGVCGGVAEYFDIDPTIVRLLFVAFTIAGGSGILFYLLCSIIIPKDY